MRINLPIKSFFFLAATLSVAVAYSGLASGGGPDQYMIAIAEKGNAWAQFHLGEWYESHRKYPEAAKWFRKAADQENIAAEEHLGLLYENGQGVPKNETQAYMWFSIAAAHSDREATAHRNALEKILTPKQVAQEQRSVREWMQQHPEPKIDY